MNIYVHQEFVIFCRVSKIGNHSYMGEGIDCGLWYKNKMGISNKKYRRAFQAKADLSHWNEQVVG